MRRSMILLRGNCSEGSYRLVYEPEAIGMETAWNKIHYNPLFGNATEWDFSKYTPQVVIVAIGQNDNHPDDYMKEDYNSERSKQWREHYKAFIEGLKKQYPEAKIVCCTTLLCHDESWDRSIGEVVKELDHPTLPSVFSHEMERVLPAICVSRRQRKCLRSWLII